MNDKVASDSPEQAEFRTYCRAWVSKNKPGPPPAERSTKTHPRINSQAYQDYLVGWLNSAYKGGLVGCDYPKEYGGGGRTDCQRIANEEMQRAGTPMFPSITALRFAAATILEHGSEFLKKRFIPKMLSGEELWCQGFSEPNAGSDVANQETFAEKKGDTWVINGQKVWTSFAEWGDWMILLARTDRSHKHKGLTYFCVPIKSEIGKSVEVRPLIKLDGSAGFYEEFFNDLTIDDKYRLGAVGEGWSVAMTTLKFERGAGDLVEPAAGGYGAVAGPPDADGSKRGAPEEPIIRLARNSTRHGKTAADDPAIRDRIMEVLIRKTGFEQTMRRGAVKGLIDHPMRIPMQFKLVDSEIPQDIAALAVDIEGASSTLRSSGSGTGYYGSWSSQYIGSFGLTIAAGTSEIQRNQLGERVLGMPKSR